MKKRVLKIISLVVAIALIVTVCWFANALCGNPISKWLAQRAASAYLEEQYPNTDYYIEDLGFSFKFTGYYAHVRSESSIDTQFSLNIDMTGNVFYDTFEDVKTGYITSRRLEQEYRELTKQIFESPAFPYKSDIQYGTLEIHSQEYIDDPLITDIPDYALVIQDLILDKIYDIRELGRQAGRLIVYIDSDTISFELAAKILLDIREEFDNANIPFRAIDFSLQPPLPDEGPRTGFEIHFKNFPYEDIYEEGLEGRIKTAHDALEAYFAELDAQNK